MSRNKKLGYVILLVAFVIVSVVAFALPTAKTTSFWVAYIFTCIAFAAQVLIWNIGFKDNTPLRSKFLGIPVIRVGYIYLVFQLIALAVLVAYPALEDGVKKNGEFQVRSRMVLKKSTLIKWMQILKSGKYPNIVK